MINRIKHFYLNKYIVSPFSRRKYFISYCFKQKAIWFRNYKVATRTIDKHLKENSGPGEYIYSSSVGYLPAYYNDYFKFAFVRHPVDRFISAWKDKVLNQNYFKFDKEKHKKMMTIRNFIEWVKEQNIEKCDEHIRAQYALIDINNVDFIGRFETFEKDFAYLADKLGFPIDKSVKLNKSGEVDVEIDEQDKKSIKEIYKKDFFIFYPDSH